MTFEFLQHGFMIKALIVGVFTAVATAVLGNFVVAARQSMVSDMLAHMALAGVGLGIFWQVSPGLMAFVVTVLAGISLWWLSRDQRQAPEAVAMLLLTGGLAVARLLAHLNKNNPILLDNYLFGSILTVTDDEVYLFGGLALVVVLVLIILWRPFLTLVFDRDFLQTQRNRVVFELMLMVLIALVVGIGLRVVGGLLIGAMLVIPVLTSQVFTKSFRGNVIGSVVVNVLGVFFGILSSFYLDVPASSGIVLSLIGVFLVGRIWRLVMNRF